MQITNEYIVPDNRLGILLTEVKKVNRELGDQEFGSERLSHLLGYDKKTTNFYKKLADLNRYKLLEGKGKKMRVSELAKQALGNDEDKIEALQEIFKKIKLWEVLQNNHAENLEIYSFAKALEEITGTVLKDKDIEWVRSAYLSDIRSLKRYSKVAVTTQDDLQKSWGNQLAVKGSTDSKAMVMRFEPLEGGKMLVEIKGVFSEKLARQLQQAFITRTND